MRYKLAIVGAENQTRGNAPFDNPDYDLWTFSDWLTADWMRRCDAVIEVHAPAVYRKHPRTPEYWQALRTTKTQVYMCPVVDPKVPAAIEYPLDGILDMLAGTNCSAPIKPFNCTLAYALALGVFKEYQVIDVYGVELANNGGYSKQSSDFAFWVGFAAGRGIAVNINCSGGMFSHLLYGVEDTTQTAIIYELIQETIKQRDSANQKANAAGGALQVLQHLLNQGGASIE